MCEDAARILLTVGLGCCAFFQAQRSPHPILQKGDELAKKYTLRQIYLEKTFTDRADDARAGEHGRPEFHQLPAPEDEGVFRLTTLVSQKIQSLLEQRGFGTEADSQQADPLSQDDPGMAALLADSVRHRIAVGSNAGHGVVRLGDQIDGDSLDPFQSPRCAMVSGFNVHAMSGCECKPGRAQPSGNTTHHLFPRNDGNAGVLRKLSGR